jgi:hypothetical protein
VVQPLLSADWRLQQSFDVGDGSDEFAVACVVFDRPEGGSLNVTLQRRIAPFAVDAAVASHSDYDRHAAPSGSDMVTRDVPHGPRQVILRRSTGLMINLTTSVLLGRGVPVPYSLPALQAMAAALDRDAIESVFPTSNGSGTTVAADALRVPSVIGMRLGLAQELLSAVGLCSTVDASDPTLETARVVGQEPEPGGLIDEGEAVRLHVRT